MSYCDIIFNICIEAKDWINLWIAVFALLISFISLLVTTRYASKSFTPIVTAFVKTHFGGNEVVTYDLVLRNSGTIPARKIKISVEVEHLNAALGVGATPDNKRRWLACFESENLIPMLQDEDFVSCSFGTTRRDSGGFWEYGASFPIKVEYRSWFGKKYENRQYCKSGIQRALQGISGAIRHNRRMQSIEQSPLRAVSPAAGAGSSTLWGNCCDL